LFSRAPEQPPVGHLLLERVAQRFVGLGADELYELTARVVYVRFEVGAGEDADRMASLGRVVPQTNRGVDITGTPQCREQQMHKRTPATNWMNSIAPIVV